MNLTDLDSWIDVIKYIIVGGFSAGVMSTFISNFFTRGKIKSEATNFDADSLVKKSVADKTNAEMARELYNDVNDQWKEEQTRREKLERKFDELESRFDEMKRTTDEEIADLKKQNKLLRDNLITVHDAWVEITDKPFPLTDWR